jgi:prefoldin subunit 5
MSRHSEIHELEREIAECEEAISDLENEEEIIRRLQSEITNEAEEPVKAYDMTASDEFRGSLEEKSEDARYQICKETDSAQNDTTKLLSEIAQAKERIREHIEKCRRRIEQLEAEIEAESRSRVM